MNYRFREKYASTAPGIGAFFGNRSVVIHFSNQTRFACANFSDKGFTLDPAGVDGPKFAGWGPWMWDAGPGGGGGFPNGPPWAGGPGGGGYGGGGAGGFPKGAPGTGGGAWGPPGGPYDASGSAESGGKPSTSMRKVRRLKRSEDRDGGSFKLGEEGN